MTVGLYGATLDRRESTADWEIVGGHTTDDRRFSVHTKTRGRHVLVAATGLVTLLAAACSGSSEAATDRVESTFRRAEGSSIAYEKPVAKVSDLVAPGAEGDPWLIVGSVFDPEAGTTVATTWTAKDGRSWKRAEVPPADKGVSESMAAVVPGSNGDGALAVGWIGDGDASNAAVWRQTADGWERSTPEAMAGDHEQWAFDVATGAGGTLVAGGESVWGEVRARLWFSADGTTWKTVDGGSGGPFDTTGDESVRDIAAVGKGFVAVGSSDDNGEDGAVWYSPNGQAWSRVKAPSLGGPGRQELRSVAWTGHVVVAGGLQTDANGQGQPVVWRSVDGKAWGAPSAPLRLYDDTRTAAADYTVRSITFGRAGLIAAGGNDWRPHLWRSVDEGKTWARLPNPVHGSLFADGVGLVDAANDGTSTIALGAEPTVLYLDPAQRWQDTTGKAFPNGGAQPFATSLAVGKNGTVAGGGRHTAPQGAKRETFAGQIWLQRAGSWKAIDSKRLDAGQVSDVAAYKGGYVAVGVEDFGLAAKRDAVGDPLPDGLVWTSADGRSWKRIGATLPKLNDDTLGLIENPSASQAGAIASILAEEPPETVSPAGGDGTRSLGAVAPLGNGYIAVGVAYVGGSASPIVVASPDGKTLKGEDPGVSAKGTHLLRDVCVHDGITVAVGAAGQDRAYDVLVRRRDAKGSWSAVKDDGSFRGDGSQQAYGCAAGDDGFIAVGSDDHSGDTDARVWVSKDGRSWRRVASGLLGGGGDQWASAAAAVPGGGWLIGGTDTAAGDGNVALWRLLANGEMSRRDRGETALGGTGQQSVTNIVVDKDRVLIAGEDYGRAGLWESDTVDR